MKVLVAYGSKRQGTAGIADVIAAELRRRGIDTDLVDAGDVRSVDPYDAVLVGGALYASRWHRDSRRLVKRCTKQLRAARRTHSTRSCKRRSATLSSAAYSGKPSPG